MQDWDSFRYFQAVADKRSFSAAAKSLGTSQPTVGRVIGRLERELGTKLFARTAHGLVPTPEAERILGDVRRMSDAARDAERKIVGPSRGLDGLVRIAASEGIGTLWLTRRLAMLRAEHPALRFELVISATAVDLSRREADVAIRLFRPTEPDLVIRPVGKLGFGLFASPSYLAARGTPKRLSELARHDLIGFPRSGVFPKFAQWLHRLAPDDRFVVLTGSLLAQHEAARAGLGIVLGTEALLQGDRTLRRILPRASPPPLEMFLVAHADVRRSATVGAVFDRLHALLVDARLARPKSRFTG